MTGCSGCDLNIIFFFYAELIVRVGDLIGYYVMHRNLVPEVTADIVVLNCLCGLGFKRISLILCYKHDYFSFSTLL